MALPGGKIFNVSVLLVVLAVVPRIVEDVVKLRVATCLYKLLAILPWQSSAIHQADERRHRGSVAARAAMEDHRRSRLDAIFNEG